ncbi:MAG: selenocysteine-specific translation elongation factor [Anaerolineae bacterium]|nr:selenocysteine-specific translation elongation factor [Anaerolineae bacterium]
MRVIGTAGHVDHGKSTLVHALTGIDPDRLAEEKARQMTIDLGFAWLTLPDGEAVGVVDVPGHIDFIKNMLAGVGGIDAALFVVAADEGIMPQTREHLAILDLLAVPAGVVALTKVDLVADDPEWIELVRAEVADALAGTSLAAAPIVPVSARTGEGLPALLAALQEVLRRAPPRPDLGRPRLPIDRAFTMAGFGTVVTGTLVDGRLTVGQEVEIVPGGLRGRIRGLQTHKRKVEVAVPGSRVAVNLTGVSKEQVARGQVLCTPGTLEPTVLVDVRLRVLADAAQPLRHNQPVDFFCGAAEVGAYLRLLDTETLPPGCEGWAQLRLNEPAAVARGDRFILRQASPSRTLAGGVVVNPHPGRRWRRFRPEVVASLAALHSGEPTRLLQEALARLEPTSLAALASAAGLDIAAAQAALQTLVAAGQALALDREAPPAGPQAVISREGWEALRERLQEALAAYHRQYPLRAGMPREELKSRLQGRRRPWSLALFNEVLAAAAREGWAVEEGNLVRLPNHAPALSEAQQAAVERLMAAFAANPTAPPSVAESAAAVGPDVLAWLVETGRLVQVSPEVVFEAEAYRRMVQAVVERLQAQGRITVAEARDMFGTSRKYVLALLEHLDAQHITRRMGDERVLRRLPPGWAVADRPSS